MSKVHADRLRKLADHITTDRKLERFSFAILLEVGTMQQADLLRKPKAPVCGTVGCAMGELPCCFPRHWRYELSGSDGLVIIAKNREEAEAGHYIRKEDVAEFFGLTIMEQKVLFFPVESYTYSLYQELAHDAIKRLDITPLNLDATAEEVASNLRKASHYVETRRKKTYELMWAYEKEEWR